MWQLVDEEKIVRSRSSLSRPQISNVFGEREFSYAVVHQLIHWAACMIELALIEGMEMVIRDLTVCICWK